MVAVVRGLEGLGWWSALVKPGPRRLLGVSGLIDALGTGLAAIALPFFMIRVAGLSPLQLAVLLGAGGVAELLMATPAGVLAARFGTKRYNIVSRLGRGLVYSAMPLTNSFITLLVLAVVEGTLRAANGGLTQAMATAVVGEEARLDTLAVVRVLRNIGYLLGSGLAAVVLASGAPGLLRGALLVNALSFGCAAVVLLRLRFTFESAPTTRANWSVLRDYRYCGLICSAAVFASSAIVLDVALPLWLLKHDRLPSWTVAAVVTVNTALVILLQHRVSSRIKNEPGALRELRAGTLCFVATAVLIGLSGSVGVAAGVLLILLAAVFLTFGEMTESTAWWVLSYEFAPKSLTSEYLAAFDMNRSLLSIVGPTIAVAITGSGLKGWLVYGLVVITAYGLCRGLVASDGRRGVAQAELVDQ